MSTVRTPKQQASSAQEHGDVSQAEEAMAQNVAKRDFKEIRKRIAKRFPKTIEHLAK